MKSKPKMKPKPKASSGSKSKRRVFRTSRLLRFPYDVREEIAKQLAGIYQGRIRVALSPDVQTRESSFSEAGSGHITSVVLVSSPGILQWARVLEQYHSLRSPRRRMDSNTLFWIKWSPCKFLQHFDFTITGPLIYQCLSADEVAGLGRQLALCPLRSLVLRTQHVDPLFNGVVQWPRQGGVTDVVLVFTRKCPPNEWKRPFFPHLFTSVTWTGLPVSLGLPGSIQPPFWSLSILDPWSHPPLGSVSGVLMAGTVPAAGLVQPD
ncbi:hypothetical protein NMY22_g5538 [Coprinellus aureogranulatus]|nr:hypothetical protein NMY22_g5538 [Coprinellus aureogranulatus]